MYTTKFSKAGRQQPLIKKFAEGGAVDPDDRRRYRKATKEEEAEFPTPSRLEQILTALAGKIYKKEDLQPKREQGPVVGLGPRG